MVWQILCCRDHHLHCNRHLFWGNIDRFADQVWRCTFFDIACAYTVFFGSRDVSHEPRFSVECYLQRPTGLDYNCAFLASGLPIVDMILASQQIETWFMPYSAVNNVIRVLALLDRDLLVGENALMAVPVTASLLVVAAYIVGFSAVSIYLFKRRDM